jgi:hypothetical protein
MKDPSGASRDLIRVLVADSNQTQSQLLSSALRRQPGLKITCCGSELSDCLQALRSAPAARSLDIATSFEMGFVATNQFTSYVPNLSRFFLSSSSSPCVCVGPFSLLLHLVIHPVAEQMQATTTARRHSAPSEHNARASRF